MKQVKLTDFAMYACVVLSLFFMDSIKDNVIAAIKSCAYTIVPSLFVMCVLSTIITKSGAIERLAAVFKIDGRYFSAFILGNISGYPIGAKVLSSLVEDNRITKADAERAICFCFASGPAFCLGVVGGTVFKSKLLGVMLFLSIFLSNLTLYIFFAVKRARKKRCGGENDTGSGSKLPFSDLCSSAVVSSAYSMVSICSAILFFSAIIAVVYAVAPFAGSLSIVPPILEISRITSLKYAGLTSFVIVAVLMSFGGLCVHMQVKSIASFSLKQFYITRPVQLLLTAFYAFILYAPAQKYLPANVKPSDTEIIISSSDSLIPFVCVLLMIVIAITHKRNHSTYMHKIVRSH